MFVRAALSELSPSSRLGVDPISPTAGGHRPSAKRAIPARGAVRAPPVESSDSLRDARPRSRRGSDGFVAVPEARELDSVAVAEFAMH